MDTIPLELTTRISDFSIGNQSYWKTIVQHCSKEINMFEAEALVDEFLCNLHVSVNEFISDFRKFSAFSKRYKFCNILIGRAYQSCSEEDYPFIDVIHHELDGMGMLHTRPEDYYVYIFNKCLYEVNQRNKIY